MMRVITIALVALVALSACAERNEHMVGRGSCQFLVPADLEVLPTGSIIGSDESSEEIYLRVRPGSVRDALPVGDGQDFRFIVTCQDEAITASPVAELNELGLSLPVTEVDAIARQTGTDLYRIYKNESRSSWILVDFDPAASAAEAEQGRLLAHCDNMSASARDEYRCVHAVHANGVWIEYRFGPAEVSALDEIDHSLFSLLRRRERGR